MFHNDAIVGSWAGLAERLDARHALSDWSAAEPALAGYASVDELVAATAAGSDPTRADDVLGALVRLASRRGGGDGDALLLVLHLLSDGICALVGLLIDLDPDVLGLVVGAVSVRIRDFGAGARGGVPTRAFAATLLRDARRAVIGERRPHGTSRFHVREMPVDPSRFALIAWTYDFEPQTPSAELADVLTWAERAGIAARTDLTRLLAAERSRDRTRAASKQGRIARDLGVHPSTLRRHREQTIAALRAARTDYLAA